MKICPVCRTSGSDIIFKAQNRHGRHLWGAEDSFPVQRCRTCGLIFPVIAKIDEEYYARYYPAGYYEEGIAGGPLAWIFNAIGRVSVAVKQAGILRFSRRNAPGKLKLLDIGCGAGFFLGNIDGEIFDKAGLEVNKEGVASCRKKNINVYQGGIDSAGFGPESFDVVTMWHVLEHLEDPSQSVKGVRNLLKKGGVLALSTPNTRSLAARLGREFWFHLDAPRHLSLFNDNNLKSFLEGEGFEVKRVGRLPWEFPLDMFWSLRVSPLKFLVYPLYPLWKFFDDENIFVIAVKA